MNVHRPWRSAIENAETKNLIKELLVSFVADDEPEAFWNMWRQNVPLRMRRDQKGIEVASPSTLPMRSVIDLDVVACDLFSEWRKI